MRPQIEPFEYRGCIGIVEREAADAERVRVLGPRVPYVGAFSPPVGADDKPTAHGSSRGQSEA